MVNKKICIIGAGMAGLGGIGSCLEEGLTPVCYEFQDDIGGLWRYTSDDIEGRSCVMKSTIINSSKEMSTTSTFIIPGEYPNYMHNTKMFEIIQKVADHFNVRPYIHFFRKVVSVTRADDYDQTGKWKVRVQNTKTEEEFEEIFDGVLVSNGHHTYPLMPEFKGLERFNGRILHSHSFKTFEDFKDQNVVVVGSGNSAMDASVEVSNVAKKTYLSMRSGAWIISRKGPWGMPTDVFFLRRIANFIFNTFPYNFTSSITEAILNQNFDHELYNVKPKHRFHQQHPTLQDVLPSKIISGTVQIKKTIQHFTEDGILFEGETEVTPVDSVIMATGYRIHFPFLNDDVIHIKDNKAQLYKFIFPPDHKHPTMAFMGLFQSLGPGFPPGELQARWVTRIFSGKQKLPEKCVMEKEIKTFFEESYKRFKGTPNHTIHVDYINYMDDLAATIGCKPNMLKLLFTDPKLFFHCFFGPCLSYQYRLSGPGAWDGAREAILTSGERVTRPLNSGIAKSRKTNSSILNFKILFMLGCFIVLFFWLF